MRVRDSLGRSYRYLGVEIGCVLDYSLRVKFNPRDGEDLERPNIREMSYHKEP
jgi:hypothetical protein